MYALIANIIALLSDLLGRITPARADKLDQIDVIVSSRAPARTAVSNAVLTDARIGYLDNIASAPMRIKSIQRGLITIFSGGGTDTATATITAVDVSKSELRMLGYLSNSISTQDSPYIRLLNSTTIQAKRYTNNNTMSHTISWELVEYY